MVPEEMPKSVLVIGSGAIGIEFASFYDHMGADVTVVEVLDRVLPVEDEESRRSRASSSKARLQDPHQGEGVGAQGRERRSQGEIQPDGGEAQTIEVERVILAVGIVGNVENIGIEDTNVQVEQSHIVTDEWPDRRARRVRDRDVAGAPWLAHKASHEGVVCVERIKGLNTVHPLDVTKVPGCTYCTPQVASVGLTEKAAKDKGYDVKVGRFPYVGNGKGAVALGETEGMVKTVFDADRRAARRPPRSAPR